MSVSRHKELTECMHAVHHRHLHHHHRQARHHLVHPACHHLVHPARRHPVHPARHLLAHLGTAKSGLFQMRSSDRAHQLHAQRGS